MFPSLVAFCYLQTELQGIENSSRETGQKAIVKVQASSDDSWDEFHQQSEPQFPYLQSEDDLPYRVVAKIK